MRFCTWKFAVLAVLLVMLSFQGDFWLMEEVENVVFIFSSLLVFRWIDDGWSFYLDRQDHPERTYLQPGKFMAMVLSGSLVFLVYKLALFSVSWKLAVSVGLFFSASTVLYLIFYKNRFVMKIIPLLKYPVFIWLISGYSSDMEIILICAGAFFMMLYNDLDLKNAKVLSRKLIKTLVFAITGCLILQPWLEPGRIWIEIFFIVIPVLLIWDKRELNDLVPLVYFPLIHLADILI